MKHFYYTILILALPCLVAAQKVGIGTTNPLVDIHLHGSTPYNQVLITPTGTNDTSSVFFSENSLQLGMEWLYDGAANHMKLFGRTSATNYYGPFISVFRGPATRVGIGVNTPQEVLDVDGGIRLGNTTETNAGTLRWNGTEFQGYNGSSWKALASKWNEEFLMTDNIYYNAGNVGIGTSGPDYLLDIDNDVINRSINIGGAYTGALTQSGVHIDLINQGSGNKFGVYSQLGNAGENNANTLYGVYTYIPFTASGTHYGLYADISGVGHKAVFGKNSYNSGWAGYFEGRGHVAGTMTIGTETELGQLHVHAPGAENAALYLTPATTGTNDSSMIFLAEDHDATYGVAWIYDGVNNRLNLLGRSSGTYFGPHMSIERDNGRVALGSDDLLGRLHVHEPYSTLAEMFITPPDPSDGDSSKLFFAEDDDASYGMFFQYNGGSNFLELFGKSNSTIYGPHLRIARNSGDVAIGNEFATGHRLSVDGKIACEELRVELSGAWPDYVFSDQHQRMSLEALSDYIEANAHLPGIPAATEIESNGLEVGEMQRKMMEKIEELTLYMIELNEEVEDLKKENALLRSEISNHSKK